MPRSPVRAADSLMASAVAETLDRLTLAPEDAAAARLARHYADAIDRADNPTDAMDRLGPKLLTVLESLGATPAARARLKGGVPTLAQSRLAVLRAARK